MRKNEEAFQCTYCGAFFVSQSSCTRHLEELHLNSDQSYSFVVLSPSASKSATKSKSKRQEHIGRKPREIILLEENLPGPSTQGTTIHRSHKVKRRRPENGSSKSPGRDSIPPQATIWRQPVVGGSLKTSLAEKSALSVFDVFLLNLKDVQLLKTCRLVSSDWNVAACESLKIRSVVNLKEGSSKLKDFHKLLLSRAFGPMSNLPTFIQNFRAQVKTLTDPIFNAFLDLPSITITELVIKMGNSGPSWNPQMLLRILHTNRRQLRKLSIFAGENFRLDSSTEQVRLSRVKEFNVEDVCTHCAHKTFFKNILDLSSPKKISLDVLDGDIVLCVLSNSNVNRLEELRLTFLRKISRRVWKHLAELTLQNVRTLSVMYCSGNFPADKLQRFTPFIKTVSANLRHLVLNFPAIYFADVAFPNLQTIETCNDNGWNTVTSNRFPRLHSVVCLMNSAHKIMENEFYPHVGVKSVTVRIFDSWKFLNSLQKSHFHMLLSYIARQFPCVDNLTLAVSTICDTMIMDISDLFPTLKALHLDGSCDFFSISGMQDIFLSKYLEMGWPVDAIPRRKSILDFKELKSLHLSRRFETEPRMFTHCISKIPALTCLRFSWNESLSTNLIQSSVGHLQKIVIVSETASEELTEFFKNSPNVDLVLV